MWVVARGQLIDARPCMAEPPLPDKPLAERRYITLLLRLLVDGQGVLVTGQVGSLDDPEGAGWTSFRGVDGLVAAVQARLMA
jgi:hypothetical protein